MWSYNRYTKNCIQYLVGQNLCVIEYGSVKVIYEKNNIQPQNSIPVFFIYIMYIIILYDIVDLGPRFYIELKFINFSLPT